MNIQRVLCCVCGDLIRETPTERPRPDSHGYCPICYEELQAALPHLYDCRELMCGCVQDLRTGEPVEICYQHERPEIRNLPPVLRFTDGRGPKRAPAKFRKLERP